MTTSIHDSLSSKLLTHFIVFIILPFLLGSAFLFHIFQQETTNNRYDANLQLAEQIATNISNQLDSIENISQTIREGGGLIGFLSRPYYPKLDFDAYRFNVLNFIKGCSSANPNLDLALYMTNDSIPRGFGTFYHLNDIDSNLAIQDFLTGILDSNWYIGDHFNRSKSNPYFFNTTNTFVYLEKIFDYNNALLGVLSITAPIDYFIPNYTITSIEDQVIFLNLTPTPFTATDLQTFYKHLDTNTSTQFTFIDYPIPDFPWSLFIITPTDTNLISFYLLAIIFLSLLILCLYLFSKYMIKLVETVNNCLHQMTHSISNQFRTRLKIESEDELGLIALHINNLLDEIELLLEKNIKQSLATKEAQLTALQHQINPHFIYNTLEIFSWRMELNGCFEESDALTAFANIFRYNVNTTDSFVTIQEELHQVNHYLSIQALKYPNIHLALEIPPELLSQKILKFIFQPLIENCLSHGLSTPEMPLSIIIRAKQVEDTIVFEVIDTGTGITQDRLLLLNQKLSHSTPAIYTSGNSIGLTNINSRLQLFYGETYGLELQSVPHEYTCIRFQIKLL